MIPFLPSQNRADVLLSDGTNVNHQLVKDGWCWWYRENAPGNTRLESLEKDARDAKKGLWADPAPIPPWEWRKRESPEWASLFLGVGELGFSLRRSQRDHDFRAKIKSLPLNLNREGGVMTGNVPHAIRASP